MAVPRERVYQTGGYYTRVIKVSWELDNGPSYADYGPAPLQLCPEARQNIEELLDTHRPFGIKLVFGWNTIHPSGETRLHHNTVTMWVSPAVLAQGNMAHYTFDTLLAAVRQEYHNLVENNEKLMASNVSHDRLQMLVLDGRRGAEHGGEREAIGPPGW